MTTYSYIQSFFRSILLQSQTIGGRFFILPKGGSELNHDDFEQVILKDMEEQPEKTFPLSYMVPPRSNSDFGQNADWETFNFTFFFLTTTYYDGANQIKDINEDTQTSQRSVVQDWDEMKQAAVDFMKVLDYAQRSRDNNPALMNNVFRLVSKSKTIVPVSFVTSKRLSGVRLDFSAQLYVDCGVLDYLAGFYFVIPERDGEGTILVNGPNSSPFFSKVLSSGLNITVLQEEHGVSNVRGVTVLTPDRAVIDVYVEIRIDKSVYLESNIDLSNHILIIY